MNLQGWVSQKMDESTDRPAKPNSWQFWKNDLCYDHRKKSETYTFLLYRDYKSLNLYVHIPQTIERYVFQSRVPTHSKCLHRISHWPNHAIVIILAFDTAGKKTEQTHSLHKLLVILLKFFPPYGWANGNFHALLLSFRVVRLRSSKIQVVLCNEILANFLPAANPNFLSLLRVLNTNESGAGNLGLVFNWRLQK